MVVYVDFDHVKLRLLVSTPDVDAFTCVLAALVPFVLPVSLMNGLYM